MTMETRIYHKAKISYHIEPHAEVQMWVPREMFDAIPFPKQQIGPTYWKQSGEVTFFLAP